MLNKLYNQNKFQSLELIQKKLSKSVLFLHIFLKGKILIKIELNFLLHINKFLNNDTHSTWGCHFFVEPNEKSVTKLIHFILKIINFSFFLLNKEPGESK